MKPTAKPISSPGRPDKFPPPLMRFLRSNVGSKSRGRRSNPRKKNAAVTAAAATETQEPSSPKVTCIGQVRVRRSSTRRRNRPKSPTRRRFRRIGAALFCPCFRKPPKSNRFSIFQKWVSFFRRKSKNGANPETPNHSGVEISNPETKIAAAIDEESMFISSNSSPPRNALLLTRSKSAPYRSTSLASRFWSSPLKNEEDEEQSSKLDNNGGKFVEIEKSKSQRVSVSDQDTLELEEGEELVKKIEDFIIKSINIEGEKTEEDECLNSSSRSLILTRSKSEPSRTAEKMNPEVRFWKKRRSGVSDSCLPNNL